MDFSEDGLSSASSFFSSHLPHQYDSTSGQQVRQEPAVGALSNSGSTTAVGRKNLSLVSSGSQASTVVTQQQVQPQARPEDYLSLFVSTANLPLESQKSTLVASISCHRTSELHFGKSIWQRHKSARESSSAAAWSSGKRPPSSASATSATGSTVPRSQVAEEAPCCLVAPSYGNIPFETLHLGVNLLQCLVLVDENVFDNLALASPTGGGSAPESTNMDASLLLSSSLLFFSFITGGFHPRNSVVYLMWHDPFPSCITHCTVSHTPQSVCLHIILHPPAWHTLYEG